MGLDRLPLVLAVAVVVMRRRFDGDEAHQARERPHAVVRVAVLRAAAHPELHDAVDARRAPRVAVLVPDLPRLAAERLRGGVEVLRYLRHLAHRVDEERTAEWVVGDLTRIVDLDHRPLLTGAHAPSAKGRLEAVHREVSEGV